VRKRRITKAMRSAQVAEVAVAVRLSLRRPSLLSAVLVLLVVEVVAHILTAAAVALPLLVVALLQQMQLLPWLALSSTGRRCRTPSPDSGRGRATPRLQ
jgi:hypothetical protein